MLKISPRHQQPMHRNLIFFTTTAMIAFAGNSLLCRLALKQTGIDAASFTAMRIVSGALVLWLILRLRGGKSVDAGNWPSAFALFAYAAGFSFAYMSLPAATGALLLFGAVQATMIGFGLWSGERLGWRQWLGLVCAFAGLASLLLPGLSEQVAAPTLLGSALMLVAGISWGIYSLRGRGTGDATAMTAGNFLRAVPMALLLSVATIRWASLDSLGVCYAIASGAVASGVGYAVWYTALRSLQATIAATVQLSVPVIAAVGGIIFLGEAISLNLLLAAAAILGGIALVIMNRQSAK